MKQFSEVRYNDETYEQIVRYFHTTQSGAIEAEVFIPNFLIKTITLTSELGYPHLFGQIYIEDIGNTFVQEFKRDGYGFIQLKLSRIINNTILDTIDHMFVLSKIEKDFHAPNTYCLIVLSQRWFAFNRYVSFSNQNNTPFTELAIKIMNQEGITSTNIKDSHTSRIGKFISRSDWTLEDSVNYLLRMSSSDSRGLFFLRYNFYDDNYDIQSSKDIESQKITKDNVLCIQSKTSTQAASRYILTDIALQSETSLFETLDAVRSSSLVNFSYDKMEFTSIDKPWSKMVNHFSNVLKNEELIFANTSAITFNKSYLNTKKQYEIDLYHSDCLRTAYLYSNILRAKTFGSIRRTAGDMLLINVSDLDRETNKKILGTWYTVKCIHSFSGTQYMNELHVSRVKELARKK